MSVVQPKTPHVWFLQCRNCRTTRLSPYPPRWGTSVNKCPRCWSYMKPIWDEPVKQQLKEYVTNPTPELLEQLRTGHATE